MSRVEIDRERLAQCRKNLGITKMEAARRLGLSQPAYLRYESGDRLPSAQTIKEIARVFCTSVSYLTGETDDLAPDSYTVEKELDPELFAFVEAYQNGDEDMKRQMLAYLEGQEA